MTVVTVKFYNNVPQGISVTESGTTTDTYALLASIECGGFSRKTIIVANTDAANSLTYEIRCYAYNGSTIPYEEVSDTALGAGALAITDLQKSYALIEIYVKSTIAGSAATVQCDISGYK